MGITDRCLRIVIKRYSQTPRNPYLSVEALKYGFWGCMGIEKIRKKCIKKIIFLGHGHVAAYNEGYLRSFSKKISD
jgi:hypothetical protein